MARLYSDGSGKIYENDIFGRHTSINGGSCAFMLVLLFGGLLFSLMSSFFLESLLMALFTFIFLMCFLAHRERRKALSTLCCLFYSSIGHAHHQRR